MLDTLVPALDQVGDALLRLTAMQDVPAGKLRLNASKPAAQLVLAKVLAPFVAAYPRVSVELVSDDALADIVDGGLGAGVRFGESLAADMIAVAIGSPQAFVTVAAPDYLAARGVPQTPRDLLGHACRRHVPPALQALIEFVRSRRAC